MLKNKGLKLIDARDVLNCLHHLIDKCDYAKQIFIQLQGQDELEPWLKHFNQELS